MVFIFKVFIFSSFIFAEDLKLHCQEQVEMGTEFKICVYSPPSQQMDVSNDLVEGFKILHNIDSWMSEWRPETQLSQVNAAAGIKPMSVNKKLFDVATFALEVSKNSEGAFDPTFNAFWGLYKFKAGDTREATDAEIKEKLPLINYKNVVLDRKNQTIFLKKPAMKLGFGGLGQGYGVDEVVSFLKKRKYTAGYVDGSGDTYFWGKKPSGELWTAAIRDPRDKSKNILTIYGTDIAVTTCGDDEKFFMVGERRVHHIIDTKTGRPATASRQTTVITKKALDADAYDTAVFVLGPKKGAALLEKLNMQGVLVGGDNKLTITGGLKKTKTPWGEVYTVE